MIFARLLSVAKSKAVVIGGVALVAFAAGSGSGYLYAKRKLDEQYNEQMEREIQRTRDYFAKLHKKDEYATPGDAVKKLNADLTKAGVVLTSPDAEKIIEEAVEAMESYSPSPESVKPATPREVLTRNIFEETERATGIDVRDRDKPYIIRKEEFLSSEFDQATFTYFEGDDVLADMADKELQDYEIEETIGSKNNLLFGHLSEEEHIVYIRNEKSGTDFEVSRSFGKYSSEVAGFHDDEPTQVPMRGPRVRNFRGDDG